LSCFKYIEIGIKNFTKGKGKKMNINRMSFGIRKQTSNMKKDSDEKTKIRTQIDEIDKKLANINNKWDELDEQLGKLPQSNENLDELTQIDDQWVKAKTDENLGKTESKLNKTCKDVYKNLIPKFSKDK